MARRAGARGARGACGGRARSSAHACDAGEQRGAPATPWTSLRARAPKALPAMPLCNAVEADAHVEAVRQLGLREELRHDGQRRVLEHLSYADAALLEQRCELRRALLGDGVLENPLLDQLVDRPEVDQGLGHLHGAGVGADEGHLRDWMGSVANCCKRSLLL